MAAVRNIVGYTRVGLPPLYTRSVTAENDDGGGIVVVVFERTCAPSVRAPNTAEAAGITTLTRVRTRRSEHFDTQHKRTHTHTHAQIYSALHARYSTHSQRCVRCLRVCERCRYLRAITPRDASRYFIVTRLGDRERSRPAPPRTREKFFFDYQPILLNIVSDFFKQNIYSFSRSCTAGCFLDFNSNTPSVQYLKLLRNRSERRMKILILKKNNR